MAYFELTSPRDMFCKTKRELTRLRTECTIDNVFNFFVTAHHIQDYVRITNAVPQHIIDKFLSDNDMKDCRDLCNKGKHLKLTKRPDPRTFTYNGTLNGAPLNTLALNEGDKWMLISAGREIEVTNLAERVTEKWKAFLMKYGL